MNAFFLKLSEFRHNCVRDEKAPSFIRQASKLYLLLMDAKEEVSKEKWDEIAAFEKSMASSQEELFHYLWFLNALARYYCFILKDLTKASALTLDAAKKAEDLFREKFPENNQEKRSFLFILALNVIRLSFYKGDIETCSSLFKEFDSFLFKKETNDFHHFPEVIRRLLEQYGSELRSGMSSDDFDYFGKKLKAVEEKLNANLSSNTLLGRCLQHSEGRSREIAFIDHDKNKSYSWMDVDNISNAIAELISSASISSDLNSERYVLQVTQQNILFPASLIASWKTKSIPLMIHENYTAHELEQIKKNIKGSEFILIIDELFDEKIIEKFKTSFDKVLLLKEENLKSNDKRIYTVHEDELALGLLTSGSSGPPKICLFTHYNLFQAAQIEADNEPLFKEGTIANLRPHYTSAGLNSLWPSLLLGSRNIFSEKIRKTPISRFFNEFLKDEKLSMLILSPTYILSLYRTSDLSPTSEKKLALYFGGSSLPKQILKKLLENNFLPSMRYGMTEIAHIVSKINYRMDLDQYEKADVGIPFKNFETSCEEDFVQIKSPGNVSLIVDKGIKYSRTKDQVYRTADKAFFNEKGSLHLEGRDNQTININGFRFNTQQVEEVLMESNSIVDCRAFSMLNKDGSEQRLIACILAKAGITQMSVEKELRSLVQEKLSPFKWPQIYLFLEEWPMMPNGKIDFNKLKTLVD